ncbi:MAG: hypothetical protein OJF59_002454 [Cytophagales bacterium]|nr:MAG: hypothetical protein OJF59_002454 [Cytophagales bacterium]
MNGGVTDKQDKTKTSRKLPGLVRVAMGEYLQQRAIMTVVFLR